MEKKVEEKEVLVETDRVGEKEEEGEVEGKRG